MRIADLTVGTQIEGFWYKKDFYAVDGTIVKVLQNELTRTALMIHLNEDDKNIVTWVTAIELVKVGA